MLRQTGQYTIYSDTKQFFRLPDSLDQAIDLGGRVVQVKAGPGAGGNPKLGMQRLGTMMARTNCNA
jgi:hypothetical protein